MMRYSLTFVMLAPLLGGVGVVLDVYATAPAVAMTGLFGASDAPAPVGIAALPA
jgi:hypothetical protein